jgi:signal transduction histidine kinase
MMLASILAMVLVPLFGAADYFMYRPHFAILFTARLVSVVVSGVIFGLLRGRFGKRYSSWLGVALGVEAGLAIGGIQVYVTGVATPHYVGVALLILSIAALLPWEPARLALLAVLLAAMFVTLALLNGVIPNVTAFVAQISAILVAAAIAVVVTVLSERLRSREFAARRALQVTSKEKTRLIEHLRQKTAELEILNHDMEDLLYVASHDLRAPLINVQGFANEVSLGLSELRSYTNDIPEAVGLHADIQESLGFIQSAVSRMDALIGGLLNVSRIATRTSPTDEVQLQRVVQKIVESFRYQLEQHRITINVGRLPSVKGDPVRLNQVFSNLVDNAIKYMGESPRREIEIGMRNGNGVPSVLFVKDTGPGIPVESQETVFRLFRRLANGVPGEGLGLTMVRKIIEKHGGRIWIESSPGQGSAFCFTLGSRVQAPRKGEAAVSCSEIDLRNTLEA